MGKNVAETTLFRVMSGEFPDLFTLKGNSVQGEIDPEDSGGSALSYDIQSKAYQSPAAEGGEQDSQTAVTKQNDYWVTIKIIDKDAREFFHTTVLFHYEPLG